MYTTFLSKRIVKTKFQAGKHLRRVQLIYFLKSFQFTNFWNFVTFHEEVFPDLIYTKINKN